MICDECNAPTTVDEQRGEVVCTKCFVVQNMVLDSGPGPRHEGAPIDGHGPPIVINRGASLATSFMPESLDANGKPIGEAIRFKMKRLSRLDGRVIRREDRTTRRLYAMVSSLCTRLELSDSMRDRAFFITKQAYTQKVLGGQEFAVLTAAAVYLAVREAKRFVDLKQLAEEADISRQRPTQQIMHGYIDIKRALKIVVDQKMAFDILPAIGSTLGLAQHEQRAVLVILRSNVQSTKPEADLAAALYIVLGHRMSQKDIVAACGTTEVSLRHRMQKFNKALSTAKIIEE